MIHHYSPISGIASHQRSSTDRFIATAGYDNRVILWNFKTHEALAVGFHDHLANSCSFSKDGTLLVTASSDFSARIWQVPSMKLLAVCKDHGDDVETARFHPSLPLVATASLDHVVRVFDLTGKLVREFFGHTADVISVDWNCLDGTLVSCGDDGTIRKWSLDQEQAIEIIPVGDAETDTLTIGQDGTIFAGDDHGDLFIIIDGQTTRIPAHSAGIKRISVSPQGTRLVTISYDRKLVLWSITAPGQVERLSEVALDYRIWPRSCAFVDEGTIVFGTFGTSYATFDLIRQIWDFSKVDPTLGNNYACKINGAIYSIGDSGLLRSNGSVVQVLESLCNFVTPVADLIVAGGQNGTLYNAMSGEVFYQFRAPLNCTTVIPKGNDYELIVGTYLGEVLIFHVSGESRLERVKFLRQERWHENAIKSLASSSHYVFSVCASGITQFRTLSNYRLASSYRNEEEEVLNACAALSDFGFASVGRDKKLKIWSTTEKNKPTTVSTDHTHSIKALAANQDGTRIATGAYNGAISIYDRNLDKWVFKTRLTHSGISAITTSGDEFIASSYNGNIYQIKPEGEIYAIQEIR